MGRAAASVAAYGSICDGGAQMGASEPPVSLAHRRFGLGWTKGRRRALLVMTALVAVAALAFTSSDVRWRARLLYARSHGEYREIPFLAFVKWLRPHSIVNLFPLLESGNVRAAIRNELTDDATAEQGLQLFAYHCARCHGEKGERAPRAPAWSHRSPGTATGTSSPR